MAKSRDRYNRDKFLDKRSRAKREDEDSDKKIKIKSGKYIELLEEEEGEDENLYD